MTNKKSISKIKAIVGAAMIPFALAMPLTAQSAAHIVKNQRSTMSNHQDKAALKAKIDVRKQVIKEALDAAKATQTALLALNHNQPKQALAALQVVSGNLHLLLARDPSLGMLPIDIQVQVIKGITDLKTIKALEDKLDDLIDDDYYQAARPIIDSLVDEIRVTTVYLPLATYPNAIDSIAPLIDAGKIDGAPVFWAEDIDQPATGSTWYDEVISRVDFKDPENSLILTKPSNNHHYGGLRAGFEIDNPANRYNYDLMLNWILEGAAKN